VKTPDQALADVARRLARTWASTLTGTSGDSADDGGQPAWPHMFALGQPTAAELEAGFAAVVAQVATWRAWAARHGAQLRIQHRRVHGTRQELPTHLVVTSVDQAAALCGDPWPARLARGRVRAGVLDARFPYLPQPAGVLAAVDGFTDVDFDLLCRAADWFATNDATGLTPRQVPIEGLHAKWLNSRQGLVRELAGIQDLRLRSAHPPRVHFTYLDPDHRASGGRIHDSATVGDPVVLPYRPRVVIISENKDTAIGFPEFPGGVSVEGVGRGGGTAAAFDWIVNAQAVFYWGDMDADGLEILDGFRAAGVDAVSILMEGTAYERWRRFGTNVDPRGRPLEPRQPRPVPHLIGDESRLYHQLISPGWSGPRRIEQERIPLTEAVRALQDRLHVLTTQAVAKRGEPYPYAVTDPNQAPGV
jgi:hypothetical protein